MVGKARNNQSVPFASKEAKKLCKDLQIKFNIINNYDTSETNYRCKL